MKKLVSFGAGAVIAVGACMSGVVRPSKLLGFFDVLGPWDLSFLFVFIGALTVTVLGWRVIKGMRSPLYGECFPDAAPKTIDAKLVGGAALFGIGWGLAGACPGPAFVALASGTRFSFVFVVAMIAGMVLARNVTRDDL